jgi:hypothetical protein
VWWLLSCVFFSKSFWYQKMWSIDHKQQPVWNKKWKFNRRKFTLSRHFRARRRKRERALS